MDRRKFLEFFGCGCCGILISSCATVPITERRQLSFIPESTLNRQAAQAYEQIKRKVKLITKDQQLDNIKTIGHKIENAVSDFFHERNENDPTANFQWEYILIDDKKIKNAWCMPGGKIAVYTGLFEITNNIDGLAAVMGHEVAHAVAKHSIERASRTVLLNVGTSIADIASGGKLSQASRTAGVDITGLLRHFGIDNPFNRKQESEADYLGLIFSSISGYDIRETIKIWERMKKAKKGKEPPEWMSTHPSTENRINKITEWIPQIILNYPPKET